MRLVTANVGDHSLIHALLRAVNQSPSLEDFVTWLDEPTYETADRWLVKRGERILAHVQVLERTAWFDGVKVPIGSVQDLAVLPEYAHAGFDQLLLSAAESAMRAAEAVASIVQTERPDPLRVAGWIDVRGQGYSEVGVGDLLAQLSAQSTVAPRRAPAVTIRRWRHVEIEGVRGVYSSAAARGWGPLHRTDAYWQWLAGRKAHSDLIVAVAGHDQWEEPAAAPRIVGYAVVHGRSILELCCLPEFARFAPRLLVRAGQDAIERDCHTLSLHTPPSDPLHELVVTAGGTWHAAQRGAGTTLVVKLLDPPRWIETIDPLLRRRAKRSGLARPLQICFHAGDEQYRLVITRTSRLVADESAPADVRCDTQTFGALLLGNLNITKARDAGRLIARDDQTLQQLAALFPPHLFWQSRFDALRF